MRILLCGGGTAGHVNPAIAIAQTVLRNAPDSKVAYVVTVNGIENELVDFKKYQIDVVGLKKGFSVKNFTFIKKMVRAIRECKIIINEFRPDIIVGTGGFVTFPVIYAGNKLGVKTVLHESNAIPGKAIKSLSKKVDRIFINFKETEKYFKCKTKIIHSGNPIRDGFTSLNKQKVKQSLGIKEKYVVLCMGGSLGATRINESAIALIENLIRYRKDIRLIWSCGKREYKEIKNKLKRTGIDLLDNVELTDYIYDMPKKIAVADVVISRAGAMSISELASSGKCVIFVPSPNVVDNHQLKNAQTIEKSGGAVVITEDRLYSLTDTVRELISDADKREMYGRNIETFVQKDSNKIIYNELVSLIKRTM